MPIAENRDDRLSYKFYADASITPGEEPDLSTAPGASGAQVLRHVSQSLNLTKNVFRANEKRVDRQRPMGRHGIKRSPGDISGLLSPLTYADWFEAAMRGTWSASAIALTHSDFTSVSADNGNSRFVFTSGDPVDEGFRVGDIIEFANLAEPDNNGKSFMILGFGGTSNRQVTVHPKPAQMSGDNNFTVTTRGRSLIIPSSGHVTRKVACEVYNQDVDIARLYTERRVDGFNYGGPSTEIDNISFTSLGRNRKTLKAADAPYFSAPTEETNTDFCAGLDGLLRLNGVNLGTVSQINFSLQLQAGGPDVRGTDLIPEIFLQDAAIQGDFTVFLQNADALEAFDNETEFDLFNWVRTSKAIDAPSMVFYMPRIKIMSQTESDDGSGGKAIQCQFDAGRYFGAAPGVESTSIRLVDTEVS